MRKLFAELLYNKMRQDKTVILVTADLGFGIFNKIRQDFPDQFFNVGAAEVAGMSICVGMALEGKTSVFYSITPFALFRPAEVIRNYVNYEKVNVKIVGSGRRDDYKHDGFSHYAGDDVLFMGQFKNIECFWPQDDDGLRDAFELMFDSDNPHYLNLRR